MVYILEHAHLSSMESQWMAKDSSGYLLWLLYKNFSKYRHIHHVEVIETMYDTIIIGAGPAGIASAIYAKSRGKNVLVLEKNKVGGLIGTVSTVTHYPGIVEGETGQTFAARLSSQAAGAGIEIVFEEVTSASLEGDIKTVQTEQNSYEAKTVVIACGGSGKRLNIEGEDLGGMRLNAPKDAKDYVDENVYVIGGADGAVKEALYLAKTAKNVTIVCIEDALVCIPEFSSKVAQTDHVHVMPHSSLKAVHGKGHLDQLVFVDNVTGAETIINDSKAGVFVYAGIVPNTSIFSGLEKDAMGYLVTDENMETNIPGVYAAGDIRSKKVRQVATAVSDGAISGISAAAKA